MPAPQLPVLSFASRADWAEWLDAEHARSPGMWLKLAKAGSGGPSVTYAEALDVALCYGWIDGQKRSAEGEWWLQRFTPRGPRSRWSKINREKAEALLAAGRMAPAGVAAMEAAKADGRWDAAYDSARTAAVPGDLEAALAASPAASAAFAALDRTNRYAILYRVQAAKRAATRARRIEQFVAMLVRGEKPYP
ncbi:MAG TPA: YdeI/OmpD-associated family protein [Acidimicrobiales bacterium]|nr:YdeI/OmpD-associated family protein [Acidimicrobiales bacterium]